MEKKKFLTIAITLIFIFSILNYSRTFTSKHRIPTRAQGENLQNSQSYIIINVSDYDGETDYEKIQSALKDVPPEGAIVFIPKGTWTASGLRAFNNTFILGTNETVLLRPKNTTAPFITFENAINFGIYNITFNGQNEIDATGIYIINSSQFEIVDCTFMDINRRAISVHGYSTNFEIKRNKFNNCHEATILLFGTPGQRIIQNFSIRNNILINGTNNGKIGIAFSANGIVENNTLVGNEYGIGTRCISNITIKNNKIANSSSYGIYLGTQPADFGTENVKIADNQIEGNKVGMARYYGSQPISNITIKSNLFLENLDWDIYADFQGKFLNNTITSKEKIKMLTTPTAFKYNRDVKGKPIILADVNDDGQVDMHDIGLIARNFGITENSERWNPALDIIQDGKIDMRDIGYASQNFGIQN